MNNLIEAGTILYRHVKTRKIYQLLFHSIDCTNARDGTPVVVYSSQSEPHRVFVRETKEFFEKFEKKGPDDIDTICDAIWHMEYMAAYNVAEVKEAQQCGCYHCCSIFSSVDALKSTTDEGMTALCPICGHDAVLAGVTDTALLEKGRSVNYDGNFPEDCDEPIDDATRSAFGVA